MKPEADLTMVGFIAFALAQKPDRAINHAGWCACAVGDYVASALNAEDRWGDEVEAGIERLTSPYRCCDGDEYTDPVLHILNDPCGSESCPSNYGELKHLLRRLYGPAGTHLTTGEPL